MYDEITENTKETVHAARSRLDGCMADGTNLQSLSCALTHSSGKSEGTLVLKGSNVEAI